MSKRGKRLTRAQKILVKNQGYDPTDYLLLYDLDDRLILKDKKNDGRVHVNKPVKRR